MPSWRSYVPVAAYSAIARVTEYARHGSELHEHHLNVEWFTKANAAQRKQWIFDKVKKVVASAYATHPFYRAFYDQRGFSPSYLQSYNDIVRIPVVRKDDLREINWSSQSTVLRGARIANTGGSSGTPLTFYLDQSSEARELFHMYRGWRQIGYYPGAIRLVLSGLNTGGSVVFLRPHRAEVIVNTFEDWGRVADIVRPLAVAGWVRYLHGYPSAVVDFACFCIKEDARLTDALRGSLAGVLLGSEYPAPHLRKRIEDIFDVSTISWYGHSERAVLAFERSEKGLYFPFQTYGLCEAIAGSGSQCYLVGTSYDGFSFPFIRYNTGDLIEPVDCDSGLVESFRIDGGREGEYVIDAQGHRVSLTALIYGRHHEAFGYIRQVQVRQKAPGEIEIIVVPLPEYAERRMGWERLFDLTNTAFQVKYITRNEPFRTLGQKVPLLVRTES